MLIRCTEVDICCCLWALLTYYRPVLVTLCCHVVSGFTYMSNDVFALVIMTEEWGGTEFQAAQSSLQLVEI